MKRIIFFNSFFITYFFVLFFGIGNLFSVTDQELFEALDRLAFIVQKIEDSPAKNITLQSYRDDALRDALFLANHEGGNEALAYVGSDLDYRYGSYKYGLITYLFLYCAQRHQDIENDQIYLGYGKILSKAASLELGFMGTKQNLALLWEHPFRWEWDKQAWGFEQETDKLTMQTEQILQTFVTANHAEIDVLKSEKKTIEMLDGKFQLSARSATELGNFAEKNLPQKSDSLLIRWAKYGIQKTVSKMFLPKPRKLSMTERASVNREKNERTLLKMILGVGALAGAAFVIAYAMGYKPSFQVQQRLQRIPGWNKIQALALLLLANWKKIGAVALMTRLRFINNYYNKVIGPRIQSGIMGLTRRRAPVVMEQGPRFR